MVNLSSNVKNNVVHLIERASCVDIIISTPFKLSAVRVRHEDLDELINLIQAERSRRGKEARQV